MRRIFLGLQKIGQLHSLILNSAFFMEHRPSSSLKTSGYLSDNSFDRLPTSTDFRSTWQQMALKAFANGGNWSSHSMPRSWSTPLATKQRPWPVNPWQRNCTSKQPSTSIGVPFAAGSDTEDLYRPGVPIFSHVSVFMMVTSAPESSCISILMPPKSISANFLFPFFWLQITRLMCSFCGLLFFDPVSCKNHMSENHALSRVTQARTSEGGQSHSAKSNLQIVHNLVPNSRETSCPLCGKGFCSPNTLRNHVLKYHRIPGENIIQVASPSISAPECSHPSSENSTSSTSQEIDPIPNGGRWKCTFCNKAFPDADKYRSHMLKRHRDFFCENCDKSFKTAGYFRTHRRLHCKSKAMKRSN